MDAGIIFRYSFKKYEASVTQQQIMNSQLWLVEKKAK
jgi:hypothetical protein